MLLSIGMIVKNEEKYLDRCLSAIKPILDRVDSELIITDTGSRDRTVEIANKYTDKVLHFNWINDFSAARNTALKIAQGEWFMFLDADEIFEKCDSIIEFFASGEYKEYNSASFVIRSLYKNGDSSNFNAPRLTKRLSETAFVGIVHESLNTFGAPIRQLNDVALHYGYLHDDEAGKESKFKRNSQLLQKKLSEQGDSDPIIYLQLYECYILHDRATAEKYLERGIEVCIKKESPVLIALYCHKAHLRYFDEKYVETLGVCEEYFSMSARIRPGTLSTDAEMTGFRASSLFNLGRYGEAVSEYIKFFELFSAVKNGMLVTHDADMLVYYLASEKNIAAALYEFLTACLNTREFTAAGKALNALSLKEAAFAPAHAKVIANLFVQIMNECGDDKALDVIMERYSEFTGEKKSQIEPDTVYVQKNDNKVKVTGMKKSIKKQILEMFATLYEAHSQVKNLINKGDKGSATDVLGECQNMAVQIGTTIDEVEGEDTQPVHFLEEYCECAYQVVSSLDDGMDGNKARKMLDKALIQAENSFKQDIKVKLEVVFMPYKASMWDSLESIWKAAVEDPDCEPYVVPIPYYDRKPDHSFGQYHYEGRDFPEYVPIVDHEKYDFENRKPDIIYIHNPYDECNYVTSVDPRYYSRELKKYTDMLVYVPYYFFDKVYLRSFIICSGVLSADRVIVQSSKIRDLYIDVYTKEVKVPEHIIKEKIVSLGSPKIDAIINAKKDDYPIPDKWRRIIDGRKIVLYNTSISALLKNSENYIEKIIKTLDYFETNNDYVLWWRPHPLLESTIKSMTPMLSSTFYNLKRKYLENSTGIYDDTSDSTRAVINADIYYGDRRSTLSYSFVFTDRPVVFTDKEEIVTTGDFESDKINNCLSEGERKRFFENDNIDGHAGEKIHYYIKECGSS